MPGEVRFQPYSKKAKAGDFVGKVEGVKSQMVVAEIKNPDGESLGQSMSLPSDITPQQLQQLVDQLLQTEESTPYSFFVETTEIVRTLQQDVIENLNQSTERTITIVYQPKSLFRVRPVSRCTSTLPGHEEAILCVSFSPDGSMLATASGDTTVRIWDLNTETPKFTLRGHKNWVQIVQWSPNGKMLASGGMDTTVCLWNPKTGNMFGEPLKLHKKSITCIAWEPMMANKDCNRFATGSRDSTVRVWDAVRRTTLFVLSMHTLPVTSMRWGGSGLIYTASRDKTIKVWSDKDGKLVKSLEGHAHWVNHLCLSTDFALRSGCYEPLKKVPSDPSEMQKLAIEKYKQGPAEMLVSCSDDHTIFLWDALNSKKPIARLTGHQQVVNNVAFSPDGRWLASASFDKSVKLWDGKTGKFIATLRGHVGSVYQVYFSADSRFLLSGSKDSTCKVWNLATLKLGNDLPGHADEVFAVDWSPMGNAGASGGKDKMLKM